MTDRQSANATAAQLTNAPVQVSFEFFPPKTPAMEDVLWQSIQKLAPLKPRFVSVTYGADGSTRDRTHRIVSRIAAETGLVSAPHLTCVGAAREEIQDVARVYRDEGIRHIVALRGDPPQGATRYDPHPGGYAYAADLVQGLREVSDFDISVAAYPEGHPEAPDADFDLENLRRKLDAGAIRAITQFFYDTENFLRFRDRCVARGINAPIVPGILPIAKFRQMLNFANRAGAGVPRWLHERFEGLDDDPETQRMLGVSIAIDQVEMLRRHGISEFHFYTLNRAELTFAICHALGVRPDPVSPGVPPDSIGSKS
ncbi:MAG: methylenetetrahydrofolate reductase [Gammaproteobacteria bacterium]